MQDRASGFYRVDLMEVLEQIEGHRACNSDLVRRLCHRTSIHELVVSATMPECSLGLLHPCRVSQELQDSGCGTSTVLVARISAGSIKAATRPITPTTPRAIIASAYERSGVAVMPATRMVPAIAVPRLDPRLDTLRE